MTAAEQKEIEKKSETLLNEYTGQNKTASLKAIEAKEWGALKVTCFHITPARIQGHGEKLDGRPILEQFWTGTKNGVKSRIFVKFRCVKVC